MRQGSDRWREDSRPASSCSKNRSRPTRSSQKYANCSVRGRQRAPEPPENTQEGSSPRFHTGRTPGILSNGTTNPRPLGASGVAGVTANRRPIKPPVEPDELLITRDPESP